MEKGVSRRILFSDSVEWGKIKLDMTVCLFYRRRVDVVYTSCNFIGICGNLWIYTMYKDELPGIFSSYDPRWMIIQGSHLFRYAPASADGFLPRINRKRLG